MADFIGNLIMILIFTLSDFFERLEYLKHTEIIIYQKNRSILNHIFNFKVNLWIAKGSNCQVVRFEFTW